jgi:hypothetical protein
MIVPRNDQPDRQRSPGDGSEPAGAETSRAQIEIIAGELGDAFIARAINVVLQADETDVGRRVALAFPGWIAEPTRQIVARAWPPQMPVEESVAPRSTGMSLWHGYGSRQSWSAVDVRDRAPRLQDVWLPAALVDASLVIAVNDLRRSPGTRPVIALSLWAEFAHPRQRIGARLSGNDDGLALEITFAMANARYILLSSWEGRTIAVCSNDPTAAELIGLGIRWLASRSVPRPPKPWEDSLVQRATELGIGVGHPGAITMTLDSVPNTQDEDESLLRLGARLAEILSISDLRVADRSAITTL